MFFPFSAACSRCVFGERGEEREREKPSTNVFTVLLHSTGETRRRSKRSVKQYRTHKPTTHTVS
jgi:hypothetical protein